MENDPVDPVPPELQVWVDAEIALEGRISPADHQTIESAFGKLPGVASLTFVDNRVAIRYDPERITLAQFRGLIAQAGFRVSDVESGASSPAVEPTEEGTHSIEPDR